VHHGVGSELFGGRDLKAVKEPLNLMRPQELGGFGSGKHGGSDHQRGEISVYYCALMIQISQKAPKVRTVDSACARCEAFMKACQESIEVFNPQGTKMDLRLFQVIMKGCKNCPYHLNLRRGDLFDLFIIDQVFLIDAGQFDPAPWQGGSAGHLKSP
jgi:hypothetical protein